MKKLVFIIIAMTATSFIACEGPDDLEDIEVYKTLKKDSVAQPEKVYPGNNDNVPPS